MIERYSHVRVEAKRKAVRVFNVADQAEPHKSHHSQREMKVILSTKSFVILVGERGFEPPTPWSPNQIQRLAEVC
jgi:hypothetical protein